MAQYNNYDLIVLNESLFSDIIGSIKNLFKKIKDISILAIKTLKLDEVGASMLSLLREIPIIGRLIPNIQSTEIQAKEIIGSIGIGDAISKCMNMLQYVINKIFTNLPGSNSILSLFDLNKRRSWLQKWYQAMLNAEIEPKYANAYLMILSIKIPFYTVLYNWKSLRSKGLKSDESGKSEDDKLHPFVSGDPNRDPDTGFDETEKILSIKFQKFMQIKLTGTSDLDVKRRLSRQIIKETFTSFLMTWVVSGFAIFRYLGMDGPFGQAGDSVLRWLLLPIYFYLLFTALILTSLAIENEETFRPSNKENVNRDADGTISFH